MILKSLVSKIRFGKIKTSPCVEEVDTKCRARGNKKQAGGTFYRWFTPIFSVIFEHERSELSLESKNKKSIFYKRMHHSESSANELALKAKDDVSGWCRGRLFNTICKFFKSPSSEAYVSTYPAGGKVDGLLRCARNDERQGEVGRSMIEMLGVLAIIGALSVGGIAGYSKAMEKFKINKTIEQYSYLTAGLISNLNEFKKLNCTTDWKANWQKCGLRDYVLAANLVPADWHGNSAINQLIDSDGNMVNVFSRKGNLVLDFHLGGFSYNDKGTGITPYFPVKLCRALMSDLAQPLHSVVQYVWIYKSGANNQLFYGDNYCGEGQKCLNNLTLEEINNECHGCEGGVQSCTVTLEF